MNKVMKWEDQMAKEADIAAGMEEGAGGGNFFSLRAGTLSWMDVPMTDNQMAVVIVDSILENVYYPGDYDPDSIQSPTCFAFGRDPKEMVPHKNVVEKENDKCEGCPMNEWGSADKGKGKACTNTRRIAMIPAGQLTQDGFEITETPDHFRTVDVGYMKLNVMSVKGYAGYVQKIAGSLRMPPYGIITKVKVIPDTKSIFRVLFDAIEVLPGDLGRVLLERHNEISSVIDFPYALVEEEEATTKKKKPAKKRKY